MNTKLKILLLAGLQLSFSVSGQVADPDPSDPSSTIRFVNVGKMYVALNGTAPATAANVTLYIPDASRMLGENVRVKQIGTTATKGNFYNNVSGTTNKNVFVESTGLYFFKGTNRQVIKNMRNAGGLLVGGTDKGIHFIDFPNVEVKNPASVWLDAFTGMNTNNLVLTEGKFVLKSEAFDKSNPSTLESSHAHLLVKNTVTYNRSLTSATNGVVEVEVYLDEPLAPAENGSTIFFTNRDGKFFGFCSPYKKMYSDYFFYNYLLEPSPTGLFGGNSAAITSATFPLKQGRGYLVGQGAYPSDDPEAWTLLNPAYPGAQFMDRFKDMIVFNRYNFNDIQNKTIAVATGQSDAYSMEEIFTQDVPVSLMKDEKNNGVSGGFHYVGNPFTCPIDMTTFVDNTSTPDAWGVTRGTDKDLWPAFWVVTSGIATSTCTDCTPLNLRFTVNVTYLIGQTVGSTIYDEVVTGAAPLQIAPMQMFLVYANNGELVNFKIPASARSHSNVSFLRSTNSYTPVDELLIQVKDSETKGFDRACVVFRNGASMESSDDYDAYKYFNYSGGVSQIYLPSEDNAELSVSVIPSDANTLPLNMKPALQAQEVTLSAHRIETLISPENVSLEDKITGDIVDLTVSEYSFRSSPDDREDRFILHFRSPNTLKDNFEDPLVCYYENKAIQIKNVIPVDIGSNVQVFDMQGRMLINTNMEDVLNIYTIPFEANPGVYIVKITGNRSLTEKLIVR